MKAASFSTYEEDLVMKHAIEHNVPKGVAYKQDKLGFTLDVFDFVD